MMIMTMMIKMMMPMMMMMMLTMMMSVLMMMKMMMTVMWVSPRPVLREESSGDEELNAALIPPITFQHEDDFRDHDLDDDGEKNGYIHIWKITIILYKLYRYS